MQKCGGMENRWLFSTSLASFNGTIVSRYVVLGSKRPGTERPVLIAVF